MQDTSLNTITSVVSTGFAKLKELENYSELLESYSIQYVPVDYYYQVGEIEKVQGWILHLSAVISQVPGLLSTVIPFLASENVPFKIVVNKETCIDLLGGLLGIQNLGKVVCIYPADDREAVTLADKLIRLTDHFKGPAIFTDIQLGNIVYTRYGSFNPVRIQNSRGEMENYIYILENQLVPDTYSIPFKLHPGLSWPFGELSSGTIPKEKTILNHIYKPISFLKVDVRGNVFKALYLKKFFQTSYCVIKQGFKNMASEDNGRDIYDRLLWQNNIYQELSHCIPIPKVFDFFQEDGNSYLVIEFVKGLSLYDYRKKINPLGESWFNLSHEKRSTLLNCLIKIARILEKLHEKGFVHRDIVPVNFLVDKNQSIFLIDLELAYSIKENKPDPPFQYGTAGFISPQQQALQIPTFEDDIYAFGSLMILIITGISPVKFDITDENQLYSKLYFFIQDQELARMLTNCLDGKPELRPGLSEIIDTLNTDIQNAQSATGSVSKKISTHKTNEIIAAGIKGLMNPPIVFSEGLWYSKIAKDENTIIPVNKEYIRFIGLHEGIGGVLYLLARARSSGFHIDDCMKSYWAGWEFIEQSFNTAQGNLEPGLYNGTAGSAVALNEGIRSGILEDNDHNRALIYKYLSGQTSSLNVTSGIAGLGIAALQCSGYLDKESLNQILAPCIKSLLEKQQKDGSWLMNSNEEQKTEAKNISFGMGIPGIIWFLLEYSASYNDPMVKEAVEKSLKWLLKKTSHFKALTDPAAFKKLLGKFEKGDERKGILLTFIKAHEVFKDDYYKLIVERVLWQYPKSIVRNNLEQNAGLSGLGELYLEAFKVFKNEEWKDRAYWIAQVCANSFISMQAGSGYWQMEENNPPTADFMTGVSGIIHFLIRCSYANFGYRLLK